MFILSLSFWAQRSAQCEQHESSDAGASAAKGGE